jgi:hypothetical protein
MWESLMCQALSRGSPFYDIVPSTVGAGEAGVTEDGD